MIVKMKKISVVVQDKDIRESLDALAAAGVLHLEHHVSPKGEDLDLLREEQERMSEVIAALSQVKPCPPQAACAHVKQMFINVFTALKEVHDVTQEIRDYETRIAQWQPWGSFDPHEIKALAKKGIHTRLYAIPYEKMEVLPADVTVETVFVSDGVARVVVFSRDPIELEFEEIPLPEIGLAQLISLRDKAVEQKAELEHFIHEAAKYSDVFQKRLKRVEGRIAYQEALTGRGIEQGFSVVSGYCPVDECAAFEDRARNEHWAYVIEDPSDEDNVPTLLRNPKWVELIKPVFGIINVLPGYKENDISVVFLIFFSLFFGILIGDAAYGLVFGLLTGFVHWKFGKKINDKAPIFLMYVLSAMTVIWGVLTGTFLGQTLFPGIKPLVPWLNDPENLQRLCFFIGALHLSIAHVWRGILKWPSLAAFAEAGWLCLLWGMFFMARVLVLGDPMALGVPKLFMIGPVLVLFFTSPSKNLLKTFGSGVAAILSNVVNTFTDVVSYIRLFAVGLASIAVADAFNVMLMGLGFDNIFIGCVTALILVLGHVFNMILGVMAILVHGLRLNVLEFSTHMNLEWAGMKYEPFKKENE
jgi:V/A-type H+-transporting ATPase subunit I